MGGKNWAVALWSIGLAAACACHGQTRPEMRPFTMDHRAGFEKQSPADVSFLLQAPAGRDGFVHEAQGHLVTDGGKRIRFWGVNITDWSPGSTMIPSKKDAPMWAATLARYGVNCVRLQFLDFVAPRGLIAQGENTQKLDPKQMDREDFFLAQLEKRGIYVDFNLLVGRPFRAGDGVMDAAAIGQGAKGISLYDTRLIALQKEYAQELLEHRNPYTGLEYRNDPAVAIVEINNENAIGVGFEGPTLYYDRELEMLYNRWLAKHLAAPELAGLRREAGVADGGLVPLLQPAHVSAAPEQRFDVESRFFLSLEENYFGQMQDYLRKDIGIRCVILATADHNHRSSGYPLELALSPINVLDGHDYWEGPWEHTAKSPMVNDPLHSTAVELARTAVDKKAYTVSEVNEPFPNEYGAEQIPILAAYGDLEDWDAILWYTFEPKKDPDWKPYVGDPFDLSLDPVKMTELAAGALTFLRHDVSPARRTVARSYSVQQVFNSARLPDTDRPWFTPGFPLWLSLEDAMRISSLSGPPTATPEQASKPNPIVSDTGELTWNLDTNGEGAVAVNTARTQALIGVGAAEKLRLRNLSASVVNPFCAIVLTSLDGKAIAASDRLLLTTGARVANTAMLWNSSHTELVQWGGSPTLIEPVTGAIALRDLGGVRALWAQPLNGAGQPLSKPLRAKKDEGQWKIAVGKPTTTWYVITVLR